MEIVHHEIAVSDSTKPRIELHADRLTLAKRRWRANAQDGQEFGFILEHAIRDGAPFYETETAVYIIVQQPEEIYEITLGDATHAARVGWMIGNLHFPIEVEENTARTPGDPAVAQLLEREHLQFAVVKKVFHPIKAVSSHSHGHHHHEH